MLKTLFKKRVGELVDDMSPIELGMFVMFKTKLPTLFEDIEICKTNSEAWRPGFNPHAVVQYVGYGDIQYQSDGRRESFKPHWRWRYSKEST